MSLILKLLLGLLQRLLGPQPIDAGKEAERTGHAEAVAQSQEAARRETSAAVDARRAVDAERLRDQGTGPVTADPAAPVNADDGFRRD